MTGIARAVLLSFLASLSLSGSASLLRSSAVDLFTGQTAANKSSLDFLFHGDWGWPGENQTLVAQQMATWSLARQADFLVALGDNFYRKPADPTLSLIHPLTLFDMSPR